MFRKYDEFIIYVYEIRRKFSHLTELEAVQSVTLAIHFFSLYFTMAPGLIETN